MAADIDEPAMEDATQNAPDSTAEAAHQPAAEAPPPGVTSVAQAQRECYLKKGEELIRSLL